MSGQVQRSIRCTSTCGLKITVSTGQIWLTGSQEVARTELACQAKRSMVQFRSDAQLLAGREVTDEQ